MFSRWIPKLSIPGELCAAAQQLTGEPALLGAGMDVERQECFPLQMLC